MHTGVFWRYLFLFAEALESENWENLPMKKTSKGMAYPMMFIWGFHCIYMRTLAYVPNKGFVTQQLTVRLTDD